MAAPDSQVPLDTATTPSRLRTQAHALLDRIDERGLSAVHALLSAYLQPEVDAPQTVVGYEIGSGKPITRADVIARSRQADEELAAGKTVSLEDVFGDRRPLA